MNSKRIINLEIIQISTIFSFLNVLTILFLACVQNGGYDVSKINKNKKMIIFSPFLFKRN